MKHRRSGVIAAVGIVIASLVSVPTAASAHSDRRASRPVVEGPITAGKGLSFPGSTLFDLASVGYEQSEFFLSGTANSYTTSESLSSDGRWDVEPATTAPFKTRMVVYRPIDPKRFNGTVVVEWLNVTGGLDAAAVWLSAHDELIREGAVYIGVTVQQAGIVGVPNSIAGGLGFSGGLRSIDPVRYGTLQHPGDSFSYDIFTQAGTAVRHDSSLLLDGLKPKTVLAIGESQSAGRLTTYLDALGRSTRVWDGYLVYSRGSSGAPLSQSPQATITAPTPTLIRTDLRQPVLIFTTESDLLVLGYVNARQPDTRRLRDWEVAGTAHDDTYGLGISRADSGGPEGDVAAFQSMITPSASPIPGIIDCAVPINAGSHTYEIRAAIVALDRWVRTNDPPPRAPRLDVDRTKDGSFAFDVDINGNARGGIRTPQVAAPIATLSGVGPAQPTTPGQPNLCQAFGTTVPFSHARLVSLYPTHARFVHEWDEAVDHEVRAGFLLPFDAARLKAAAAQSTIPS